MRRRIRAIPADWCRAHIHVGDLQIARRGFEVGMTEQDLNGAEIGAGFEQVRGEGVSPIPRAA